MGSGSTLANERITILKYQWILFDADETIFEFNSFLGLQKIMAQANIPFSRDDYERFQQHSRPLWILYQEGKITADELAQQRFDSLIHRTPFQAQELNQRLQLEMVTLSPPLSGVPELLAQLYGKVKMGLITNGYDILQKPRLQHTGLNHYFDLLITSEAVGYAKPDIRIFQAALSQMGEMKPEQVLMVGDSLHSDILGGRQAGMSTCWFNPHDHAKSDTIIPDFEIKNIQEIMQLIN